jgi:hypothetical protein
MKRARLFQAPEEKSPEELAKMAEIDMRCLSLCTAMLERVMSVSGLVLYSLLFFWFKLIKRQNLTRFFC